MTHKVLLTTPRFFTFEAMIREHLAEHGCEVLGTRDQPDVRRLHRSDGYDVWHAILASTADVFVTFERRLADHVERIPRVPIRVVRSIKDLLASIGGSTSPGLGSMIELP